MARWDKLTIKKDPKVAHRLMGNAAQACVDVLVEKSGAIPKLVQESQRKGPVVIICGPGNNGGDGFAMAVLLKELGVQVEVFFLGKFEKLSLEAQNFYEILIDKFKVKIEEININIQLKKVNLSINSAGWVVDALFGTGLRRKVSGRYQEVIQKMNASPAKKMAVDMPSGISGDTGEVLGISFHADYTVTFQAPKWGQVTERAWDAVGQLIVKPIGLKQKYLKTFASPAQWLDENTVKLWFQKRPKAWHKGRGGRVLAVAGSREMPGAGYLSGLGALRSGAGLVHWALPEGSFEKLKLTVAEVILDFLPDEKKRGHFSEIAIPALRKKLAKFHALALGPGWGNHQDTRQFLKILLKEVLPRHRIPYVLDADALNALSQQRKLYRYLKGAILTPHPKEMSRLLGRSLPPSVKERIKIVRNFAKRCQVYLILKSYRSILATPQGEVWLNSTGGPNLAVAGSGDVLTGIIAGLLAQGFSKKQAMLAGAYLHGRAGDLLAQTKGDRGTLASEIATKIPEVIEDLR